jgi:hypothetical protein
MGSLAYGVFDEEYEFEEQDYDSGVLGRHMDFWEGHFKVLKTVENEWQHISMFQTDVLMMRDIVLPTQRTPSLQR